MSIYEAKVSTCVSGSNGEWMPLRVYVLLVDCGWRYSHIYIDQEGRIKITLLYSYPLIVTIVDIHSSTVDRSLPVTPKL